MFRLASCQCCSLATAHCPLPTAHCPLPTAHCLLFFHLHAIACLPRLGSAPASITPESPLNLMTVGAEGLPHAACKSILWPRDARSSCTCFGIRSSRFKTPGLNR